MKKDNIEENSLKNLQKIILEMGKIIFKICEEENINLFMLGGTFLGAVRHKGFIPWDDDIDFAIPREQYNKFLNIIEEKLPPNFKLLHYSKNDNLNKNEKAQFHFIKIVNLEYEIYDKIAEGKFEKKYIFIDIFPLDYIPENFFVNKIYKIKVFIRQEIMRFARMNYVYNDGVFTGKNKLKKFLFKILIKIKIIKNLNYFDTIKKFDREISKYEKKKEKCKYISNILGGNGIFKEMFKKELFDQKTLYDFEDTKFLGAKDYDTILTQMYSDYMKLPDEKNRICKHVRIEKM